MSAFSTKCIMDTMRDSTNLEDNYQEVRNIPSLLICNQNGNERIQKGLLENSVLLGANFQIGDNCLNQNFNDKIYGRNVPVGNVPVNVDMRAIPSGKCVDPRFQKDRSGLEKYNKYEVNMKCNDKEVFMPNKGTVSGYFNNIDLDSELKNINQIDTKCSKRFFKINPEEKKSKIGCYKDVLVKDYQKCENDAGYTWCKHNKHTNFETFPECYKKEYTCAINKESRENAKVLNQEDILIMDGQQSSGNLNVNGLNKRELLSGQLIDKQKINDTLLDLQLLEKKKQMVINNFLEKETYQKQKNIYQYKNNGHTNIYAPVIQKREHNLKNIEQLGYQKGLDKALDIRIEKKLGELENEVERKKRILRELRAQNKRIKESKKCDPLREYSPSVESIHIDRYARFSNSNIYDVKCRGQTKKLYKFNNLVSDNRDCQYCEHVFNNQTKRKHISVGNVPNYILNQK